MSALRISRRSGSRSGFTLIEVVLAMGIFLLGATAILGFLTFGATMSRTASLRTLSAEAVEAIALDLEEGLFPLDESGAVGEPRTIVDREVPGYRELTYTVQTVEDTNADLERDASPEVRVDIEIKWKGGVSRRGRRLSILLLKEVPFGERLRRQLLPAREEQVSDQQNGSDVKQETQP